LYAGATRGRQNVAECFQSRQILTVGHSSHTWEQFLALLNAHAVNAIYDVRSAPYSQMHPQFNRETIAHGLAEVGIAYSFFGGELGGRSDDSDCYDGPRVRYDWLAKRAAFRDGLARVLEGVQKSRVAPMCAEKEPLECHRTILVSRHLVNADVDVQHILGDGTLESHGQTLNRLLRQLDLPTQGLFRSHTEVIEDAYRAQERRIAHVGNGRTPHHPPSVLPRNRQASDKQM
jgi:uncharacterized protein (DUF488 family)